MKKIIFSPKKGTAGQTNIRVDIFTRDSYFKEPVKVKFLAKKEQGEFVDCASLGNDLRQLEVNKYIKIASDPITSGADKIELYIDIEGVNTPQSFSKIYVVDADDKKFLSDGCFKVEPREEQEEEEPEEEEL
jgi:hypothetical protein